MLKRTLLAGVLTACLVPGSALAVTAEGQEILDALSPEFREYVMSRMGPEQTVRGLVETTILNQLSQEYPEVEQLVYMTDEKVWEVIVVTPEGSRRAHRIDYSMLDRFYRG
jgi:hypothetical protein